MKVLSGEAVAPGLPAGAVQWQDLECLALVDPSLSLSLLPLVV